MVPILLALAFIAILFVVLIAGQPGRSARCVHLGQLERQ